MKNVKPYSLFCVMAGAVLLAAACVALCAPPQGDELENITGLPAGGKTTEKLPAGLPEFDKIASSTASSSEKDSDDIPPIKPPVKNSNPTPPPPAEPIIKPLPVKTTAAPASKPVAKPQPAPVKAPVTAPVKKIAPVSVKPAAGPQTEEQKLQNIILKLQMENSRLMEAIIKGRQANVNLTGALRESRMHASDLESEIRRKEIELTIKNEKVVLEKLKTTASTQPAKTAEVLQQENNILALQLKLSRIDEPQRTREMLETIGSITRERDTLSDKNKRLHTMLNEQIKKNEQSGEELKVIRNNLQSSEKEIARLRLEIKAYKEAMANPTAAPRVEYVTNKPVSTPAAGNVAVNTETSSRSSGDEDTASRGPVKIEINRIAGKITSIDDQIIKINVGSLHGLQAGMRLIVYRRDKFVGYLRVDIVGDTTAAGAMSRQVFTPQIGDNVVDRL